MKYLFWSILTFCLLSTQAQELDIKKSRQLTKFVREQIDTKKSPGLAVGIVKDGNVVFEEYVGYADLKKDIAINKGSRFNYASSGKQFTAFAVLQLIEDGEIKLSDDIRKFLPDFYPKITDDIQIQHLLTHTSGIRDVYDLWSLKGITWWEQILDNEDAIALLRDQEELSFQPGSQYQYSNSNYILLTKIIEKITAKSFKDVTDKMFVELGMESTSFEPDHTNIDRRVLPYGFWKKFRMYEWNSELVGDGALFTTLQDQLKWEMLIQEAKNDLILRSQLPIKESSIKSYGYGLEFKDGNSYHHGSTGAYGATFYRYPKENLSIVVFTNYTNISSSLIADKCYELLTENTTSKPIARKPEVIGSFISVDSLLGTYKTPGGYYYRFVNKSDTLFLERTNREPVALEHEQGNIYHEINDPDFQQEFTVDTNGELQVTAYYPSHDPYSLTRNEVSWQDYDYKQLNGTYYNTELDVAFEMTYLKDDEFQVNLNENTFNIQMFEPNILWFNGYKAIAKMEGNKKTFFLYSSRTQKIRFTEKK